MRLHCLIVTIVMSAVFWIGVHPAAAALDKEDYERIAVQLKGEADAKVKAVDTIRSLAKREERTGDAVAGLRRGWLKIMVREKMHREVLELTDLLLPTCLRFADKTEDLMRARVQAHLGLGHPDEALAEAKSVYNIATMAETADALQLLADALSAAHPSEPQVAQKFKMQQLMCAQTTSATQPAVVKSNILLSIKVDGEKYEGMLDTFVARNFTTQTGRGNIYLLADKPEKAMECFIAAGNLLDDSSGQESKNESVQNIARALKAVDGGIGRANAFLAAQRITP